MDLGVCLIKMVISLATKGTKEFLLVKLRHSLSQMSYLNGQITGVKSVYFPSIGCLLTFPHFPYKKISKVRA